MPCPGEAERPSALNTHHSEGCAVLSTCRITIGSHLGMRFSTLAPHSCQAAGSLKLYFSHYSFQCRVWYPRLVWLRGKDAQGLCSPIALLDSSTEFPLVTCRTKLRCRNEEQTQTRWHCFTLTKPFQALNGGGPCPPRISKRCLPWEEQVKDFCLFLCL